ncbi:MAG: hypothetical protein IT457_05800 [Planctomycetes bacterium]|nr:hypothetical protein [Planctomycetota bacterium]
MTRRTAPLLALLACLCAVAPAQNSTAKDRAAPSALAARCGEAVAWQATLGDALAAAKAQQRLVFWYVPTLRGSPMDRKSELDLYLRAGPFSWPPVLRVLGERFVATKQVPPRDLARQYGFERIAFVEPGFLVLDAEGKALLRLDEITTLSPHWFLDRFAEVLPADDPVLAAARADTARLAAACGADRTARLEGPRAETVFAAGALAFWNHDEARARATWQVLLDEHADDPWAWKAAAELEGHGPIVNGLEVPWHPLAPGVAGVRGPRGTLAPLRAFDEQGLRRAALAYFESMQRSDGGFVDSRYDFGGTDSLPNVWTAITALAAQALLEIAEKLEGPDAERAERLLERALAYVADDAHLARDDQDEQIWAHLYRARLASRWLALRPSDRDRIEPLLRRAVRDLVAMQPESGAWFHEYANPFVIGACLVALHEAKDSGVEAPAEVFDRGVLALLRCRTKEGAISYGYSERGEARAQVEGGAGRMPLAELALLRSGHGNPEAMTSAIEASFRWHEELAKVRKYDDHASRFGYGGFFFWFDLHARSEAIVKLPPSAQRTRWIAEQRAQIEALPEIDGAFVDSHELGRVYGTAMAQLCLAMLARG